jgi:hypothetical protein
MIAMSLNWESVRAADVEQACRLVESGQEPARTPPKGISICIIQNGHRLPAKHVLKLAYCIANRLPLGSRLEFASGDSTIKLLRSLGFEVERVIKSAKPGNAQIQESQTGIKKRP